MACTTQPPIFRELNADDPDPETTVIESCCMNCFENVISYAKTNELK